VGHLDNEPLITWLICRKRHTSVGSFIESRKKRRTSLQKLQKETYIGAFTKGDRRRCRENYIAGLIYRKLQKEPYICGKRPTSLGSFAGRDLLHHLFYGKARHPPTHRIHLHTYFHTHTTPEMLRWAHFQQENYEALLQKKTQVIAHLQRSRALLRRDRAH